MLPDIPEKEPTAGGAPGPSSGLHGRYRKLDLADVRFRRRSRSTSYAASAANRALPTIRCDCVTPAYQIGRHIIGLSVRPDWPRSRGAATVCFGAELTSGRVVWLVPEAEVGSSNPDKPPNILASIKWTGSGRCEQNSDTKSSSGIAGRVRTNFWFPRCSYMDALVQVIGSLQSSDRAQASHQPPAARSH